MGLISFENFNSDFLLDEEAAGLLRQATDSQTATIYSFPSDFKSQIEGADRLAMSAKIWTLNIGTLAVLFTSCSLVFIVLLLLEVEFPRPVSIIMAIVGMVGFLLAWLSSRYSPRIPSLSGKLFSPRQTWLENRFVVEKARCWHFHLIVRALNEDTETEDTVAKFKNFRAQRYKIDCVHSNTRGEMYRLIDGGDRLHFSGPKPPSLAPSRNIILPTYLKLRLEYQLNYLGGKLGEANSGVFWGVSLNAWGKWAKMISSFLVVAAILSAMISCLVPNLAGISLILAITGLSVRVWGQGMALQPDRVGYQYYYDALTALHKDWLNSKSDEEKLIIALRVEEEARAELEKFLRCNAEATFLF